MSGLWAAREEGSWKCPGCLTWNQPRYDECPCCETKRPGSNKGKKAAGAGVSKDAATGATVVGGISFGGGSGDAAAGGSGSAGGFALNLGGAGVTAAPAAPAAGGFALNLGGAAPAPAPAPAAASGGFSLSFGAAASGSSASTSAAASSGGFSLFGGTAAPAAATAGNGAGGGAGAAASSSSRSVFDLTGANRPDSGLVLREGGAAAASSGAKPNKLLKSAAELRTYFVSLVGDDAATAAFDGPEPATFHRAAEQEVLLPAHAASIPGHVLVFGSGDCEQLGLGDTDYDREEEDDFVENDLAPLPRIVPGLAKISVVRLAVGGMHNMALTNQGRLYSWGCNDDLVLARDGEENLPYPVQGLDGEFVISVDCGDCHTVAVTASGKAFAWGTYKGADGYIGFEHGVKKQATPFHIKAVERYGAPVSVACGANHSVVVTSNGVAVAWGDGAQGQLGRRVLGASLRGNRHRRVLLTPYKVLVGHAAHSRSGLKVANAYCGGYHTFLTVKDSGDVYATGLNNYGQLGIGDAEPRYEPTLVHTLKGANVVSISGGLHSSAALTDEGRVFVWGRGDNGQLGITKDKAPVGACCHIPVALPPSAFGGHRVRLLASGSSHCLAVTDDNSLWSWGIGDMYQLGNGGDSDERVPHRVAASGNDLGGQQVLAIGGGGQHSAVLVAPQGTFEAAAAKAMKGAKAGAAQRAKARATSGGADSAAGKSPSGRPTKRARRRK